MAGQPDTPDEIAVAAWAEERAGVDDEGTPVLVVVLNAPDDLRRARDEGWYRIPLARAPRRIAAEYLAFYLTGAFPAGERWSVRWLAAVSGYHVAARRDLLPDEPDHPRAGDLYYKISLGPLQSLPHPVPSRRLRRITFIATTLAHLSTATEINDLWIKSTAQERLWSALRDLDIQAERQYPLSDDLPQCVADFALPSPGRGAALIVVDEPREADGLCEAVPPDYALARGGWQAIFTTCAELVAAPAAWARRLAALAEVQRS